MVIWLKNPLAIYTGTQEQAEGGLVVENDRIIELVALGEQPKNKIDQTVNCNEQVIIPGLINTHHHFFQTLTRAFPAALNKELFPWLKALYPVWQNINESMLQAATELAMAELMLSGCTTASDHHYVFPEGLEQAIDIQIAAAKKLGMRVVLTRGSMSPHGNKDILCPHTLVQPEQVILDDSIRLINQFHQRDKGAMVQIALAPCAPFVVSFDLMRETAKIAKELDVGLHTHLAETLDEQDYCLANFNCKPLDYLEEAGWLTDRTWLAHGVHFDQVEQQRLAKAGVGVCHCPTSNMLLSSGICPAKGMVGQGVKVGLGVDGSASNDCSNMISEVRMALYLQKLHCGASEVDHLQALNWGTQGSAKVLRREDIGTLAVGKQADIAFFKLDEMRFSGAHDPLAALILCNAQKVDKLMINGKWRVDSGQLIGVDVAELQARHRQSARDLAKLASL